MNTQLVKYAQNLEQTLVQLLNMRATQHSTHQHFASTVMYHSALQVLRMTVDRLVRVDPYEFRDFKHDIRGKLTPILGYARLLTDQRMGMLTTSQQTALETIQHQVLQICDELDYLAGEMLLLEMDGVQQACSAS